MLCFFLYTWFKYDGSDLFCNNVVSKQVLRVYYFSEHFHYLNILIVSKEKLRVFCCSDV